MINEKQVIFKCTTCEYFNDMERGMPDYIEAVVEYESFTDVYEHMMSQDYTHNIIAIIREEDDKPK